MSLDIIQPYKALGSGWELTFPDALTAVPQPVAAAPATLTAAPIYAPAEH